MLWNPRSLSNYIFLCFIIQLGCPRLCKQCLNIPLGIHWLQGYSGLWLSFDISLVFSGVSCDNIRQIIRAISMASGFGLIYSLKLICR